MTQRGYIMTISETLRLEMHNKFREVMGARVADIVMEHLPAGGWSDIARKTDLDHLSETVELRFKHVELRFEHVDRRFAQVDSRLAGIVAGLWALGSIMSACFVGLFTLLAMKA